jgi:hypothetical protein
MSSTSRAVPLVLFSTALCVMAAIESKPVKADTIPSYFLSTWTVDRDCTEAHASTTIHGHTVPGLQLRVRREADSSYTLVPVNNSAGTWSSGWGVKVEYRAGAKMATIPADMECVPGQEESSPFLAQAGFAVSAEPYYPYEHWYGTVTLHGDKHHVLIFPQNVAQGPASAAIVLIDEDAAGNMQLDSNGTIIIER